MKKCLNCGYERQEEDDHFVLPTECPECHAIYEKVETGRLKKEYAKAEEWLAEKEGEKKHAEAVADQKTAARLGSTVAKDDLPKKSRANKIILGIIAAIVALIIIRAWQENMEKNQREEKQRQEVIAADQARIKAEQERTAFQEEYERERQKKMIHDMVYGRNDNRYRSFSPPHQPASPLDDPMRRMEMESLKSKVDGLESKLRREKSDREFDKIMKGEY